MSMTSSRSCKEITRGHDEGLRRRMACFELLQHYSPPEIAKVAVPNLFCHQLNFCCSASRMFCVCSADAVSVSRRSELFCRLHALHSMENCSSLHRHHLRYCWNCEYLLICSPKLLTERPI
ncbi:hypothetical protein SETIT_1G227900v2 [Setaria italica]|uniref:Uncharacterized protein n=2 Tax=Setaria italica TaxID=4555 RepID=K3YWT2_SETIT|nr:hypothetical protein SETIT_1G227900v2 [Setaria italica]